MRGCRLVTYKVHAYGAMPRLGVQGARRPLTPRRVGDQPPTAKATDSQQLYMQKLLMRYNGATAPEE